VADGGSDPSDRDLRDLIDSGRRADAAESRRHDHWLRAQAAEGGTLAGVLTDLGERGVDVVVTVLGSRRVHGVVQLVGRDVIGIGSVDQRSTLVAIEAVASVRAEPGTRRTSGDRPTVRRVRSMASVLGELVASQPAVGLHVVDGSSMQGRLMSVGLDVISLAVGLGQPGGAMAYVPMAAVADLTIG
jgi:hypothetical protein